MTTEELLAEISAKLDSIVRLLACGCAHRIADGGGKQIDQIAELNRAGLGSAVIADLLGTTRNTVSVALSRNAGKLPQCARKRGEGGRK